jgi:hypothetical protein
MLTKLLRSLLGVKQNCLRTGQLEFRELQEPCVSNVTKKGAESVARPFCYLEWSAERKLVAGLHLISQIHDMDVSSKLRLPNFRAETMRHALTLCE